MSLFGAHKVSFYCIRAITLRVMLWRASGIPPPNVWRVVVKPTASKVARCTLIGCDSRKEKTGASSGARINGGEDRKNVSSGREARSEALGMSEVVISVDLDKINFLWDKMGRLPIIFRLFDLICTPAKWCRGHNRNCKYHERKLMY